MKKRELEYTILLQRMDINGLDFPIYIPVRPLIGFNLGKEKTFAFIDILSGEKHIIIDRANAMDLPMGVLHAAPISEVRKTLKERGANPKHLIKKVFQNNEMFIYYFSENGMQLNAMLKTNFESMHNIEIDTLDVSTINKLTDALIKGNITKEEFSQTIYGETLGEINVSEVASKETLKIDIPISEAYNKIKTMVIAQDEAVKKVLISIYKAKKFSNGKLKSNILLYGPSGVGKTEIARSISKVFDIPLIIEDMTRYTEAGYVGASVEDILSNLYYNADEDIERAENSILVLDEIDKKASKDSRALDFNKGDVLKSLLKIVEGGTFNVQVSRDKEIVFDTSKLIIIAAGAFSELYEENTKTKTIGFNSNLKKDENSSDEIDIEKFTKYGIPLEFIGRFPTIIRLNSLSIDNLLQIIKGENSILRTYEKIFKEQNINLEIPDSVLIKLATLAHKMGTGARGLNAIIDNIFESVLFELMDNQTDIETVIFGENIDTNHNDFTLKRTIK